MPGESNFHIKPPLLTKTFREQLQASRGNIGYIYIYIHTKTLEISVSTVTP